MNNQPDIQRLGAGDIAAICSLWERAGLSYRPKGRDTRAILTRRIEAGSDAFFGIFDDGRLIAVALATHDGRKGWINRVAVDPEYQRGGLARRLVERAEEYLHGEGMQIIAILIEGYNQASLEFFKQCGYVVFDGIHYLTKRDNPDV
jgi:GNAT superfamily N-acetyltransferase